MRIYADEEIIEKAYLKTKHPNEVSENTIDITVDFDDEKGLTHSYVVTFKKGESSDSPGWIPSEINEISSL